MCLTPKISIIIPIYNVVDYIEKCLLSVLNQTYTNIEVILVNDCTPDSSFDIINEMLSKNPDKRVHIVTHETNKGLVAARYTGFVTATGDYFFSLDGDDYLDLNAIEMMVNLTKKDHSDIVFGNYIIVFGKDDYIPYTYSQLKTRKVSDFFSLLTFEMQFFLCGKLIASYLFKDLFYPFNISCGEDNIFLAQIINKAQSVSQYDGVVFYYVQRMNSISNTRSFKASIELYTSFLYMKMKMKKNKLFIKDILFLELIHSFWLIRAITHKYFKRQTNKEKYRKNTIRTRNCLYKKLNNRFIYISSKFILFIFSILFFPSVKKLFKQYSINENNLYN
jgi:glycosyltransferase involved in cell wall biosynthesis